MRKPVSTEGARAAFRALPWDSPGRPKEMIYELCDALDEARAFRENALDAWHMEAEMLRARLVAVLEYAEQHLGLCPAGEICPGADHGSCVEFRKIIALDPLPKGA